MQSVITIPHTHHYLHLPRLSNIFFNYPAPTEIYPLSLHDALPIFLYAAAGLRLSQARSAVSPPCVRSAAAARTRDRKSTRLNSSHMSNSYAVFCLKKKKCEDVYTDCYLLDKF